MKELSEGQKAALSYGFKTYWRELLIVLLLLGFAFLGWYANRARGEAEALRSRIDLSKTVAEEEARLEEVRKREADLYPKIEARLKELAGLDADLAKKRAELDKVTRRKIEARVEKLETSQIAEAFKAKGYPCTVIKGQK